MGLQDEWAPVMKIAEAPFFLGDLGFRVWGLGDFKWFRGFFWGGGDFGEGLGFRVEGGDFNGLGVGGISRTLLVPSKRGIWSQIRGT